jgi:IS5 family transposase
VIHFRRIDSGEVEMADRQLCLAEALLNPQLGTNARLEAIEAVIDWKPLEALASRARPARSSGRPPYAVLPLLKALYLQMLYNLSDKGLEEALADRLSFRRFCGYGLEETTPDETTVCRFRKALVVGEALEACFEEVGRQLDAKGLVLRRGTLLDATIVPAASRKPGKEAGKGAGVEREPGAAWTVKNGRSYFGYRLHVGADQGSGLIRRLVWTPARINESVVAEALICGDEPAIYADKGYENKHRRARLKAAGVRDRICHRSHKHQKGLPHWQSVRNAAIAKRRAPVERIFGTMKRTFGFARARYTDFCANFADAVRFATVYNLRRAASLLAPPRPATAP